MDIGTAIFWGLIGQGVIFAFAYAACAFITRDGFIVQEEGAQKRHRENLDYAAEREKRQGIGS